MYVREENQGISRKNSKTSKKTTAQLLKRYVWLVETIYHNGRISFEDINKKWRNSSLNDDEKAIPLRTFHDHRKEIQEIFDVNVDCDRRDGHKYYIEDADDLKKDNVRKWMLNSFFVNNLMNENPKLKHRILFEQIPIGKPYLTQIIEAMRDERTLEMNYHSFKHENPLTFEIEPYCLKIFENRWYLVARSPYKDAVRIYSFDRMKSLKITETTYKMPDSFDAADFFKNAFGIFVNEKSKPCAVELKVFGESRKYMQTLPLHHSQEETETSENYSVFSYFLCPASDLKQKILSFGEEIEVIFPEWFRADVVETVRKMNGLYNSAENIEKISINN